MKVLQVHTRYRLAGGEDTVVDREHDSLQQAGHEVVRYIVRNPDRSAAAAGALLRSPWNSRVVEEIRRIVADAQPDVAHVHNTWFAASPAVIHALSRAGVPVVMTLHNYRLLCLNSYLLRDGQPCEDCVGRTLARGIAHRCYRGSVALSAVAAMTTTLHRRLGTWTDHVDAFVVLNRFARDLFVQGGLPTDRLLVKANATDDPGPRAVATSASNMVLFVGRLDTTKGVDVLVDAWRRASLDLELVIIGDGPLYEELARRLPPRVRLLGRRSRGEVVALMGRARALAFPSVLYEGQPMVILEALAAGLAIVASDLGGNAELLRRVDGRMLAAPGDVFAWVAALNYLRNDEAVAVAGRRARALFEAEFTESAALDALVSVYEHAAERRRAAGRCRGRETDWHS